MTTIDEFVVALKLDPKDFDDVERSALAKLREFEKGANTSTARIEQAMSKGMHAFYTEFQKGIDPGSKQLDVLGDQSRRTGDKIAAAGAAGAVGFKTLTGSLLEAYAVVGTLEGAFHKLEQGAQRATATVMTSLTTGIAPRQVGALAGMFPYTPATQSFGAFQQIKSWAGLWQAGQFPQQIMNTLTRYAGIAHAPLDTAQLGSVRGMLMQISGIERKLPVAMRGPFLQQLGLPQTWLPELLKNPAQLTKDFSAALARMPAEWVTEELFRLEGQTKKTEQSWTSLWETIEASAAKHGGIDALKGLDKGLQETDHYLGGTNQGAEVLNATLKTLAIVVGVNVVAALAKLAKALGFLTLWRPVLAYILPKMLASPGFSLLPSKHIRPSGVPANAIWMHGQWYPATGHPYPSPSGTASPTTGAPSETETHLLGEIRQRESSGNYTSPPSAGGTASGAYGIIDSTWAEATKAIGQGTQYAHAYQAPPAVQDDAAHWLLGKYGANSPHTWASSGPYGERAAAGDAASMLGKQAEINKADIEQYLRTGGVGMDPTKAAWCAAFVNASLQREGIKGSGSMVATSFAKWGIGIAPKSERAGDVLVEMRGLQPGQIGGHVGLATGAKRMEGGHLQLQMVSGNSRGGKVGLSWVDANDLLIRRHTIPLSGLSHVRHGAGALNQPVHIHIGSIPIHAPGATDARGIAREVRGALHRELTQRSTARVISANSIFE